MYLCCDLGGTNATWAVFNQANKMLIFSQQMRISDYEDIYQMLEHFLDGFKRFGMGSQRITNSTIALAGPTGKRQITITNVVGWDVNLDDLSEILKEYGHDGFCSIINDFEALGYGILYLFENGISKDDYSLIHGRFYPQPIRAGQELGTRSLVCGPGTGLGIACIAHGVSRDGFPVIISSEGGHHSFAPESPGQYRLLSKSGNFHSKVSYEEIVSGPGLRNVYNFFRREDYDSEPNYSIRPEEIVKLSRSGKDQAATDAVELVCEVLASFCGNMVLTFNCDRAVFLWGGVLQDISVELLQGRFRRHFSDRCNHSEMVSKVPVVMINNPNVPLLGCAYCSRFEDEITRKIT